MTTNIDRRTLYESDYLQWLEETVNLLKSRQLDKLDYDNLILQALEAMKAGDFQLSRTLIKDAAMAGKKCQVLLHENKETHSRG